MFSGIVERQAEITAVRPAPAGMRLSLRAADYWMDSPLGASIAVDGVCLTLTAKNGDTAEFDVVGETLARTTLGQARVGGRVNLERSLRADARIDGHFVQGHVEGVGVVHRVERIPAEQKWWFRVPPSLRPCMIPKGSVALDGISLTLIDVADDLISVALIPTTLSVTTLGTKRPGDKVNLETDLLVRSVLRVMQSMQNAPAGGLTLESLRAAGH